MKSFGSNDAGEIIIKSRRLISSKRGVLQRAILVITGLTLGVISSLAWSLGLGELESKSYLGQPLNAEIELISVDGSIDLTTIIVRQVPVEEALAKGIEVSFTPYHINLGLDKSSGTPKVIITSNESIKEPYLNLLIELRWPSGVVYREYPLLLDPLPTLSVAASTPRPVETQSKFVPVVSVKAPISHTEEDASALPPKRNNKKSKKYVVQQGDTLSKIAQRWRQTSGQNTSEVMKWLHENNPEAFARGNINQLRQGAVLQMPNDGSADAEDTQSSEATVATDSISIADNGVQGAVTSSAEKASIDNGAPESEKPSPQVDKAGGLLTVTETTRDDKTREMIDLLVRDNEALRERVEKLEKSEYLDTLKQLIVLQRQQIAELRKKLGDDDASASVEMDALLTQIGVDPKEARAPAAETKPVVAEQAKAPSTTVAPVSQTGQVSEPALVSLQRGATSFISGAVAHKRDWFTWILVGAGIFLVGLFAALYKYYRTLMPVENVEEEYEEILDTMDEGDGKGRIYYDSSALDEPGDFVLYGGEESAGNDDFNDETESVKEPEQKAATTPAKGEKWLDDSVESVDDDFDSVMQDVQRSFEQVSAEQGLPIDLDGLSETSLEGLTSEMPKGSRPNDKHASDAKGKNERRPDDEVRLSIAEKMSQYNPDEYRSELENLGFLELDELVDVGETEEEEDEVEAIIYRAKMFCEFKKYDKAIELIATKIDVLKDQRLSDALDEVCALRDASASKKVS